MVNSVPIGSFISLPTVTIVSVIGRPDLSPRTIRSMASGNVPRNFFCRRPTMMPITKCGRPTPMVTPISPLSSGDSPNQSSRASMAAAVRPKLKNAYFARLIFRQVRFRRSRSLSGRGSN